MLNSIQLGPYPLTHRGAPNAANGRVLEPLGPHKLYPILMNRVSSFSVQHDSVDLE